MHATVDTDIVGELRQLRALHQQTIAGLRGQDVLLHMRDLSLPTEGMGLLDQVEEEMGTLERLLQSDYSELAQLRVLIETSALINTSFEIDDILSQSMEVIVQLTGAERGYILLRDPNTGKVEVRIARESTRSATDDISTTVIEHVLSTGKPMVTDNASSDPRMMGSETIAKFTLRSIICVPLVTKETLIGAIYVDNRLKEGVFTEKEMNLMQAFANQTAVALENARLFADVQRTLAEITATKELLENVFASIISGVITTSAEATVTTFNRAAAHILVTAPESAIGQPVQQLYPYIGDLSQPFHNVLTGSQPLKLETQSSIPERGDVTLSLKISPLRSVSQSIQGVAMVMDDLTAEREREKTLEMLRRYLPPGMIENIEQIARLDLGGERREITTMFIFACPYELGETAHPAALMEVLNQYLDVTTHVIHSGRGIIDKYMGNEVMVLVNSQLNPAEDHAIRAVDMALDLRDAYVELYDRLGINHNQHQYRIGIHTGVATLGNVGSINRRSFTAIGDCVNLAKRLQENAKPGQIILSEDSLNHILRRASRQHLTDVRFDEHDAIQVKGRRQMTRIYEVFRQGG
ncbi:MAG: GAF domain-containing protein [Chloroflexi bacterium]|nr:GAF domain-containing protein [Chloroflexota bacterium]